MKWLDFKADIRRRWNRFLCWLDGDRHCYEPLASGTRRLRDGREECFSYDLSFDHQEDEESGEDQAYEQIHAPKGLVVSRRRSVFKFL